MEELVELIVDKYDGSLKAEHGTGLNMAPYVEREWGAKATELMWRVKAARRPRRRARARRGAQPRPRRPPAHPEDDARRSRRSATTCVECGFCEPVCPSRDADDDAAAADRAAPGDGAPARGLAGARGAASSSTTTTAIETCAADGTCVLACPVGIDTGKLVKELRARAHGERAEKRALAAAQSAGVGRARSARAGCGRVPLSPGDGGQAVAGNDGGPPAGWSVRTLVPEWCRGAAAGGAGAAARDRRARAPPPSTCPPASTASSASPAGRMAQTFRIAKERRHASQRRTDGRRGAGGGFGAGRHAGVDPRRRCGPLLRHAVELEGLPRRPRGDGEDAPPRRRFGGPTAAPSHSSSMPVPAPTACREVAEALPDDLREQLRRDRDPRHRHVGRAPPAEPRGHQPGGPRRHAPDLLHPPHGPVPAMRSLTEALADDTSCPSMPVVAAWRAIAACSIPS